MKYLQKGPFSVAVNGGDNYDETFGRKCFYCRKPLDRDKEEWALGVHKDCVELREKPDEAR